MCPVRCGVDGRYAGDAPPRAWLVLLGALAIYLGAASRVTWAAERPNLYVFLPTDVKAIALEKALKSKLPALSVTVFGRFRDFEEALVGRPPDAILVLQPLLTARSLEPALVGLSNGQPFEEYVLISAGAPLEGSLSNRLIGAVDLLGRRDTQALVSSLLKTSDVRTKLVTNVEDLLALLQFSSSDAVLVPASAVKTFTERSRLTLHVRPLAGARVGRAAVAILSSAAADSVLAQVRALDAATNRMIGVDAWRGK
jgi:hypothetical protein